MPPKKAAGMQQYVKKTNRVPHVLRSWKATGAPKAPQGAQDLIFIDSGSVFDHPRLNFYRLWLQFVHIAYRDHPTRNAIPRTCQKTCQELANNLARTYLNADADNNRHRQLGHRTAKLSGCALLRASALGKKTNKLYIHIIVYICHNNLFGSAFGAL